LSLSRQVLILIPALLILPKLFGLSGVWMAGPIADFTSFLIAAVLITFSLKHLKDEEL